MFTLTNLLLSGILLINSVAVLNEERFLARIGWGKDSIGQSTQPSYGNYDVNGSGGVSVKHQIITLISATRTLMRIPLVLINIVVILFLIVLG